MGGSSPEKPKPKSPAVYMNKSSSSDEDFGYTAKKSTIEAPKASKPTKSMAVDSSDDEIITKKAPEPAKKTKAAPKKRKRFCFLFFYWNY